MAFTCHFSGLSFGRLFEQPQSSSPNHISGPSTVFGGSIQSALGDKSSPFSSMQNSATPFSGFTGHPTFSSSPSLTTFELKKSDGHEFPNLTSTFGQPNSTEIGRNSQLGTMSFNSGQFPLYPISFPFHKFQYFDVYIGVGRLSMMHLSKT